MSIKRNHVLFLDFDGVLHPDAVYLSRSGPILRAEGQLFMWAPELVKALKGFPTVSIVLSTSWARHLGFNRALKYLPQELADRVIGATWHSSMSKDWPDEAKWDGRTRYDQISRYVARAHLTQWLSLDDDLEGWPEKSRSRLVSCQPNSGLGAEQTQVLLMERMTATFDGQ